MSRFRPKGAVSASFADLALGQVQDLDIGPFEAPDEAEFQYYVFTVTARREIVSFTRSSPLSLPPGQLGELRLEDLHGARYRVQATFVGCEEQAPLGFRYAFESQTEPEIREPAIERHGVGSLAAALLLDALDDDALDDDVLDDDALDNET